MPLALQQLMGLGSTYVDPLSVVVWESADPGLPWLPPRLLSVQGLPQERLLRASRLDMARLAAADLWLRGVTLRRLSHGDALAAPMDDARVVLSRIRDGAGHGLMFIEIIDRAGLSDVPLLRDPASLQRAVRRLGDAPLWCFLYAASASIEALAERALTERLALCPVARQVLELYHREAAPHLGALRCHAEEALAAVGRWRRPLVARRLSAAVGRFLASAFFPTPQGLAWVGVDDPEGVARASRRDPARWSLARSCAVTARTDLERLGVRLDLRRADNAG